MKKEITAVICVLLSVWFFFMGFELGSYREKKKINKTKLNRIKPTTIQVAVNPKSWIPIKNIIKPLTNKNAPCKSKTGVVFGVTGL